MILKKPKVGRPGSLDPKLRGAFAADAESGMTDDLLGAKYRISSRTATNWRLRLVGSRKKSPVALASVPGGLKPLTEVPGVSVPEASPTESKEVQ